MGLGGEMDRERSCLVSGSAAEDSQASALAGPTNVLDPSGSLFLGYTVPFIATQPAQNTVNWLAHLHIFSPAVFSKHPLSFTDNILSTFYGPDSFRCSAGAGQGFSMPG